MSFWDSRAKGESAWPPLVVPRVVRAAEEIVRGALAAELLRACDQAEVAVQVAFKEWQCAYTNVAVAQFGGDPREIVRAHAQLEQALAVAQERSVARDLIRQVLSEYRIPLSFSFRGTTRIDVTGDAPGGAPGRSGRWNAFRRRPGRLAWRRRSRPDLELSAGDGRGDAINDRL